MPSRNTGKKKHEDRRSRLNNFIIPALLTSISLVLLLLIFKYANLDIKLGTGASAIIFASFGGSAFLLFMMPRAKAASIKRFAKSYIACAVLGTIGYVLIPLIGIYLTTGLMIFLASLLLVFTDSMHPPAIALLFSYILYDVGFAGDIVVAIGVVALILIRIYLERLVFIIEREV